MWIISKRWAEVSTGTGNALTNPHPPPSQFVGTVLHASLCICKSDNCTQDKLKLIKRFVLPKLHNVFQNFRTRGHTDTQQIRLYLFHSKQLIQYSMFLLLISPAFTDDVTCTHCPPHWGNGTGCEGTEASLGHTWRYCPHCSTVPLPTSVNSIQNNPAGILIYSLVCVSLQHIFTSCL